MTIRVVHRWQTSDDQTFDDKHAARRHEAGLELGDYLASAIEPEHAAAAVEMVLADVERFRSLVAPILARRRTPRPEEETTSIEPQEEQELRIDPEDQPNELPMARRRGRPRKVA